MITNLATSQNWGKKKPLAIHIYLGDHFTALDLIKGWTLENVANIQLYAFGL
jgi:hypothetical protein